MSFDYFSYDGVTGFYCDRCKEEWTEKDIIDVVGDNEDSILMAESFDQCPECTIDMSFDGFCWE